MYSFVKKINPLFGFVSAALFVATVYLSVAGSSKGDGFDKEVCLGISVAFVMGIGIFLYL